MDWTWRGRTPVTDETVTSHPSVTSLRGDTGPVRRSWESSGPRGSLLGETTTGPRDVTGTGLLRIPGPTIFRPEYRGT